MRFLQRSIRNAFIGGILLITPFISKTIHADTDSSNYKKENKLFTTTVYAEGGKYMGALHESSSLFNLTIGCNTLNKEPGKGILYFPNLRVLARGENTDDNWNKGVDIGIGAAYQKPPFIIGAEGVYRESFRKEKSGEDFFRLWGGYWDGWETKKLKKDGISPNRLWATNYAEFEYNTLEKNLVSTNRTDFTLDLINLKGFVIGPYVTGKVNWDKKNENWNRFGEVGAGLRLRKSIFSLFFESGHRKSFNNKGVKGRYNAIYGGFWFRL